MAKEPKEYDIAGTEDDLIYLSQRRGRGTGFDYKIDVPSGEYEVDLLTCQIETKYPATGTFDVTL